MFDNLYVALLHYPVLGRSGNIVSSAVTNLDVHDIARTCRTYNIKGYYVISNLPAQREIIDNVLNYWTKDFGKEYNPSRTEALKIVRTASYLEDALEEIESHEGKRPKLVFTSAKKNKNMLKYSQFRETVKTSEDPVALLFGTSWGLPKEIRELCDFALEPVRKNAAFNHLSVRSAVAVILDRIIGESI
ncbi:MAG: RNA methyltransferase [Kosmotogaceae bacterium]